MLKDSKGKIIVYKGNPKYFLLGISDKFYKDLDTLIKNNQFNPIFMESRPYESIPDADGYILFSLGGSKGKFIKKPKLYIGADDYYRQSGSKQDISLTASGDKTLEGKLTGESLKQHWTLTPKMKSDINRWLKTSARK